MAIAVPVADTIVSVPDFGKPVVDWINAQTPSAWTAPTFQNSFTSWGSPYQAVQYRKVGDVVHLRGLVNATNGTAGNPMFTLPAGFRPTMNEDFSFVPNGATSPNIVTCSASGTVVLAAKSNNAVWLSGFAFSTV